MGLGLVIQLLCTVGLLFFMQHQSTYFRSCFAVLIVFFVNGLTYLGDLRLLNLL